jgi:hypothetical protein
MSVMPFVIIVGLLFTTSGVAFAQGYSSGSNYYYTDVYSYFTWNAIDTTGDCLPTLGSLSMRLQAFLAVIWVSNL